MYPGEDLKLTNFRFPQSLLEQIAEAQHALQKKSAADLVREAIGDYLEKHKATIKAVREARAKHSRGE